MSPVPRVFPPEAENREDAHKRKIYLNRTPA